MTRPRSQTVDYFPHSTGASESKTLFILDNRFGNNGYAFWFKLLELLGKSEGHYLKATTESDWEFLGAKTRVSGAETKQILELLATLDAIDCELWQKDGIIWSQNFVNGLEAVYKKRAALLPKKPISGTETPVPGTETPVPGEIISQTGTRNPTKRVERVKRVEEVKKYIYSDEDKILASRHIENFKSLDSRNEKILKLEQQADAIRKLRVIDKVPVSEIEAIIDFVHNDDFWKDNAISIVSWRKPSKSNGMPRWRNILASMTKSGIVTKDPVRLCWECVPTSLNCGSFEEWVKQNPKDVEEIRRSYGIK